MYIPSAFRVEDLETLHAFMRSYSFATLVSCTGEGPFATHVPLRLDPEVGRLGRLEGHLARRNPHGALLGGPGPSLAVFQGPHAYISPAWYETDPMVPTWNYAAVHVYGVPRAIDDPDRVSGLLDRLIADYESERPRPWRPTLPASFRAGLEGAIVAFEMEIERIEGKFKLNQNQSRADQLGALEGLRVEGAAPDLVAFWERRLEFEDRSVREATEGR